MPTTFAKIFDHKTVGQVLVTKDTDSDDKPAVIISIDASELSDDLLGICSTSLCCEDTDEGYAAREKMFENMTEETAFAAISKMIQMIQETTNQ